MSLFDLFKKPEPSPPMSLHDVAEAPNETRENIVREHITEIGRDEFPDDPDTEWAVLRTWHVGSRVYVETKPSTDVGYGRFVFMLDFARHDGGAECVATFCSDGNDNIFTLLATSAGFPRDHAKALIA